MNGEFVQKLGREGCIQYECNDEGILTIEIDTSKELVVKIADAVDGELEKLEGLEKSPKKELKYLLTLVE